MSLNIKPISDRVVIAPLAAETTTAQELLFQTLQKKNHKKVLQQPWEMAKKTTP